MVSWLLFVYVLLLHVQSKSYRDHRRYHHVQSAKRSIEDRLRHNEEMDLFGFDLDEIIFAPTDPLIFGSNNLKIGVAPNPEQQSEYKKKGRKLMGETLTAVFVYGRLVYHSELIKNDAEKEALELLYTSWKGVKPRRGVVVATWDGQHHDLRDMWDDEKKFIDDEYTKGVWYWPSTKTKWTHGISAGTVRAVSVYTNDQKNVGGKILRRLFYDYDVWSKLMTPEMLENFRNFGAKLYQATHPSRMSHVLEYIHDIVEEHKKKRYRVDDEYLYLYHGATIGALTTIDQDWNLDRNKVWWGPTSTSIKFDVASGPRYGTKGVVYEIRVPMDIEQWPEYADFGLMAALMISAKHTEQEVLCWNIPTEWMTPIQTQGKWFVKKYGPGLVKYTVKKDPTAVNNIQELYEIQDRIKAGWRE